MKSVINIFKNAFTSKFETIVISERTSIKSNLNIDFKNSLIFVNGKIVDENYYLKDGDICTIRCYPNGAGTALGIIALSATIFTAIGFYKTINSLKNQIKSDTNTPDETVTYPSISGSQNTSAKGRVVPLVLGKSFFTPYFLGSESNGFTTISGEDGCDEVYTNLYILGYKNIQVRDIKIGHYCIAYNDGIKKGVLPSVSYNELYSTKKEVENGEIPLNYTYTENGNINTAYYNPSKYGIKLELKQNGTDVSFFYQKIIQTSLNTELLTAKDNNNLESLYCYGFSAKYPQKVELEFQFPNGLIGYDSNGNKKSVKIGIKIEYSEDGGVNWKTEDFTSSLKENATGNIYYENGIHYFEYLKNETMRFVARKIYSTYNSVKKIKNNIIEFRLSKTTSLVDNKDYSNYSDNVYITKIRTWCYDYTESEKLQSIIPQKPIENRLLKKIAILGFQIKAKDEISNQIEQLSCVLTSKCPIYKNGKWTEEYYPTNNPASLARYVMKGKFRGDFAYDDEKIDDDSFGAFYEWCEQEFDFGIGGKMSRFACDTIVVKKTKTSDLLNSILFCGRGSLILNGSKYGVFIDKPQDITVHILNNQNIISRTNQKNFSTLIDGYQVKFLNALLDNKEDSILVIPENNKYHDTPDLATLESVEYNNINNAYRAKCMALYQLATQKLRPETWNVKVSIDGNLIEIGNKIEIQDDTISVGIGDGAEILSLIYDDEKNPHKIKGIRTDGNFPVNDTSLKYGIKTIKYYELNGESYPHKITSEVAFVQEGNYNDLYFKYPVSLDEEYLYEIGDIISFGLLNSETIEALCFGKKDNGDGTFDLQLVPYNEDIYTADSGILGEFDSKVTPPQISSNKSIQTKDTEAIDLVQSSKNELNEKINKIYATIDTALYTLDVSPEAQSLFVDENGLIKEKWFYISAYMYYKDNLLDNVTYKACLESDDEVGTWEGNKVKISTTYLKGDILYLKIKALYYVDEVMQVAKETRVQVSKIYGTDGTKIYKMLFLDGEKIKVDKSGTLIEPSQLRVEKRLVTSSGENPTDYGRITLEVVPNGKEEDYKPYVQVTKDEVYSANTLYFKKVTPTVLKVGDNTILGNDDVGALFFEVKK